MILSIMFVLAIALAFGQPSFQRFYAAAIFLVLDLPHEWLAPWLDGFAYYGSAALFDLLTIIILAGISPIPRLVLHLQKVCLALITVNMAGYVLWYVYLPPVYYNVAFVLVYALALLSLVDMQESDVLGGNTANRWHACFRFGADQWRKLLQAHGIKARV